MSLSAVRSWNRRILSAGLLTTLVVSSGAASLADPGASTLPESARNLVVLEFRDSPTQGLIVTGGMLAVPDSSGRFGPEIIRYQPDAPHAGARGFGDGDRLVFTDLRPGTYRIALVELEESKAVHRFITKQAPERFSETCRVYCDSIPALTFTVKAGEARHLGRLVRRTRPALGGAELWQTSFAWETVDERRAFQELMKRKRVAAWRDLLARHVAGSSPSASTRSRR